MNNIVNTSCHESELYEIKDTLYNLLLNNMGMKEIIKVVHKYLENTITICNSSYSVMENYPENEYTEPLENKNGTLYLSLANLRNMQEDKLMGKIFEAEKAFFFETKHSDYNMIFCPIRICKSVIGYICVQNTNRDFTSSDFMVVDILSGILSLEMQKCDFYYGSYEVQFEYLFRDLIEKTIDNPEYFKERFKQLEHTLLSNFWILIISNTDENIISSSKISYLQNQLQVIFPTDLVTYYNKYITVLITKNSKQPFSETEERKLKNFLHFNRFIGSLSYCCTNLSNLSNHYNQAYKMLNIEFIVREETKSNNSILYYENEITNALLSYCNDRYFLSASIHPDILFLLKYDEQNNCELFSTLRTYLEQNRNAMNASKALHIHKSTFFYRLNKIIDLLDLSLEDYEKLYSYELSLHILDYLNTSKGN